ncbi:hypothetical protein KIN20_028418 [Parelaphostrongylus tenuis]|uniref:Uncharacterized protein n=1 Tax=Parelaphostrongylus tenuis TaxID=148309 RepID=A0AAD5WF15_PARTN|nr:hypothetical protein KIN20_028418 [Parelaphostrongylus tenuis]
MPSRMKLVDVSDSLLDDSLDESSTAADEDVDESIPDQEMDVDEASEDAQSDTQSDTSVQSSAIELKEDNSNCTLNSDSDEKLTQNGDVTSKRSPRKRVRRSRNQRDGYDEENEKDEDVETDHKAMLSSADRKIQVGDDFQARVDESQKVEEEPELSEDEREQVMWRPPGNLDETKLVEYCEDAVGVYSVSYDRALYILQKSNFDFDLARERVKKRRVVTEEWSEDDRTLFKQAFHMFGKRFDKIRQTMPYRSMASIVQFYYKTKKEIDYKSLYDSRISNDSDEDKVKSLVGF